MKVWLVSFKALTPIEAGFEKTAVNVRHHIRVVAQNVERDGANCAVADGVRIFTTDGELLGFIPLSETHDAVKAD